MAARSLVFGLHHTRNGIGNSTPGEISLPSHSNDNTNGKPIQTDRQDDGSDPGLDDDQCSTKSMTDDVLNYQYLVDRAYHSRSFRSIYWAPNDELQSEAMGLCHSLFFEASNGKLFLAELPDNAQKILDVGTGTGAWAIQIDDFNEPWTFKDNSLDYINMRFLTGSVRDWKFLAGEAYRCLKEDGILESSEPSFLIESDDDTVGQTSAWNQWHGVFEEYGAHTVLDRRSLWYKRAYKDRLWKRHTSVTSESLTIRYELHHCHQCLERSLTFDLRYRLENGQEIQSTDG
ncbi:hypothetical protein CLIM01_13061 [Colletotrichum limetticola]|uniref:Methyltransferase domain-containing protein n=1 Tax=Colletotrichum limetticola TaxID=1209924 RepID=A0ABQ9PGI6_9PEZI|nr:hypothetical protein CLIM01_13061 [Colletotrichum limetticola]